MVRDTVPPPAPPPVPAPTAPAPSLEGDLHEIPELLFHRTNEDLPLGACSDVEYLISFSLSLFLSPRRLAPLHSPGSGVSNLSCLKSPVWWFGTVSSKMLFILFGVQLTRFIQITFPSYPPVAVGEVLNFSAYSFAPAILVTPIGGLSVVIRQAGVLSVVFEGPPYFDIFHSASL